MSSSKAPVIEISSDDASSSDDGWESYFPPGYIPTGRTKKAAARPKKTKKKVETSSSEDTSSNELPIPPSDFNLSSNSDDDETWTLSLSKFLTKEMERVVAGMSKIKVPMKKQSSSNPSKQVLGLPCPRVSRVIEGRGVRKTMPDLMDKGKRKLE